MRASEHSEESACGWLCVCGMMRALAAGCGEAVLTVHIGIYRAEDSQGCHFRAASLELLQFNG